MQCKGAGILDGAGCRWPCIIHGICKTLHLLRCSFFSCQTDIIPSLLFYNTDLPTAAGRGGGEAEPLPGELRNNLGRTVGVSARTEARAAGSPGEVGSRLLASWPLLEGQVPRGDFWKGVCFDFASTRGCLVQPGSALWMSQRVKCRGVQVFYYIKSAFLIDAHCSIM